MNTQQNKTEMKHTIDENTFISIKGNAMAIASDSALVEAIREILNGLYALRDHAEKVYKMDAIVERRLINIGIKAINKATAKGE